MGKQVDGKYVDRSAVILANTTSLPHKPDHRSSISVCKGTVETVHI